MERLILHIEYLLRGNACVIVPGIGAFMVMRRAARYDAVTELITPPGREICFNAAISNNDGMLVNSYARREGISYAEAAVLLSKDVSMLKASLSQRGEVAVGRIGALVADTEGRLSFVPSMSAAGCDSKSGYSAISLKKDSEALLPDGGASSEADDCYRFSISKRFVRHAASVAAVLFVMIAGLMPWLVNDGASAVSGDGAQFASVMPLPDYDGAGAEVVAEADAESEADNADFVAQADKYFLIVATFHSEADAEAYIRTNTGSGYDLNAISAGKVVRVSAKSAEDRECLQSLINSRAFQKQFPQSWIYEKK